MSPIHTTHRQAAWAQLGWDPSSKHSPSPHRDVFPLSTTPLARQCGSPLSGLSALHYFIAHLARPLHFHFKEPLLCCYNTSSRAEQTVTSSGGNGYPLFRAISHNGDRRTPPRPSGTAAWLPGLQRRRQGKAKNLVCSPFCLTYSQWLLCTSVLASNGTFLRRTSWKIMWIFQDAL